MSELNGKAVAVLDSAAALEQAVVSGDLSKLSAPERVNYYARVCQSLGLNPLTKPFDYISLNGKLTLYAKRDATDQLRKLHQVDVKIVGRERVEDVYVVTAQARFPDGRTDESIGAVSIANLKGDGLANALMKAETKAKRRVTLSIVGLGWLDETEVETVSEARRIAVNPETGEITAPARPAPQQIARSPGAIVEQSELEKARAEWQRTSEAAHKQDVFAKFDLPDLRVAEIQDAPAIIEPLTWLKTLGKAMRAKAELAELQDIASNLRAAIVAANATLELEEPEGEDSGPDAQGRF